MMLRVLLLFSLLIVGCHATCNNVYETIFYTLTNTTIFPIGTVSTNSYRLAVSNADNPFWFQLLQDTKQNLTVFVATDQAFTDAGVDPSTSSRSYLSSIVAYSILNGTIRTDNLPNNTMIYKSTLGSAYIGIKKDTYNVTLNYGYDSSDPVQGYSTVIPQYSNIQACNGIIHLINRIASPPNLLSEALTKTGRTVNFIYASLKSSPPTELLGGLDVTPNYSIFAPADSAYGDNLHSISPSKWSTILSNHIIPHVLFTSDIINGQEITTLGGLKLIFNKTGHDGIHVNGARVVLGDIITRTGVLHVIDKMLQPLPSAVEEL